MAYDRFLDIYLTGEKNGHAVIDETFNNSYYKQLRYRAKKSNLTTLYARGSTSRVNGDIRVVQDAVSNIGPNLPAGLTIDANLITNDRDGYAIIFAAIEDIKAFNNMAANPNAKGYVRDAVTWATQQGKRSKIRINVHGTATGLASMNHVTVGGFALANWLVNAGLRRINAPAQGADVAQWRRDNENTMTLNLAMCFAAFHQSDTTPTEENGEVKPSPQSFLSNVAKQLSKENYNLIKVTGSFTQAFDSETDGYGAFVNEPKSGQKSWAATRIYQIGFDPLLTITNHHLGIGGWAEIDFNNISTITKGAEINGSKFDVVQYSLPNESGQFFCIPQHHWSYKQGTGADKHKVKLYVPRGWELKDLGGNQYAASISEKSHHNEVKYRITGTTAKASTVTLNSGING